MLTRTPEAPRWKARAGCSESLTSMQPQAAAGTVPEGSGRGGATGAVTGTQKP
jgi:hypothetical protein